MPEFGLNLQNDANLGFDNSGTAISFAKSRVFTPSANITITEINAYGRLASGASWDLDFYVYEADGGGTPTNRLAGPFSYAEAGSSSVAAKIGVTGLSVSISQGTNIALVFISNTSTVRLAHPGTTSEAASKNSGGATATWSETSTDTVDRSLWAVYSEVSTTQNIRKSSTFDIETTLGTITTATLNSVNVFDHVTGQVGTTVSFAGAATDEITTSGEYDLLLGDGATTETITVQVNVYGVAPSNNPLQKDGSALASLTGVQVRVTDGANINGTELYYSGSGTTDASGNLGNIDLSSTAAEVDDSVLLHMRTSAGESIIASETVELI